MDETVIAPTVTKLPPEARGGVLLTGSHGGRYAGRAALLAGMRAALFHDAGIGREEAGIGALPMFDALGVPAAAVSHRSARIGDAADMLARGRISRANAAAEALGVRADMAVRDALTLLRAAPPRSVVPPEAEEARSVLDLPGAARRVVLVDSASLVRPEDAGAIVVTGSHGGLVGGDPAMALRADAFAAAFNDAGIGADEAGLGRLPALDERGIAAVAVACGSARIGEAQSTYRDGIISALNAAARSRGAEKGAGLAELFHLWAEMR